VSRELPEWIAKHDDQAIPDRVKERIARKAGDCCKKCGNPIAGKSAEFDHAIPLILGGQHRESNLQLLCTPCHGAKTKLDVKLKAKVARVRKKHLGISRPRQQIQSRGFQPAERQRRASSPVNKWRGY